MDIHSWKTCKLGGCDECCGNPDCDGICEECRIGTLATAMKGALVACSDALTRKLSIFSNSNV